MAANSKIEWCDHTFNPWIGCTKVSQGCANCYAERDDKRRKWTPEGWGKGKPRKRTSLHNWNQPLKWERQARETGKRFKVFCASLADIFDHEAPQEWRDDLWRLVEDTPHLDWLLLTKRPENIMQMVSFEWFCNDSPSNVWLGITTENQREFDARWNILAAIAHQSRALLWLSVEPMLEPIDLTRCLHLDAYPSVDWIVVGGESGCPARPFCLDWARDVLRQCRHAGVPCFVKQLGSIPFDGTRAYPVTGKGDDPNEWPEDLRVREFPTVFEPIDATTQTEAATDGRVPDLREASV